MRTHFDVIGLGAGSAGATVARRLARAGRSVALVEARRVGGECPFVACMPSKALLRSVEVRQLIARGVELGAISVNPMLESDRQSAFALAVERRDEVVHHRDDSAKAKELEDLGVQILRGRGQIVRPGVVLVNGVEYGYADLVVGTGSSPVRPEIEGLDGVPTWTSDEALTSTHLPRSIAILGGGPVGCELAQIYARFGTQVTLVEAGSKLLGPEEATISKMLADFLVEDGIDLRLKTRVTGANVSPEGVRLELSTGSMVDCERILLASGRTPNTDGIGLDTLGIAVEGNGLVIDKMCRIPGHPNVWAAGDVTAVAPYTHTANYQAGIIASNILTGMERKGSRIDEQETADYEAIPRAVYTDPPVASVGMDEATAKKTGIDAVTAVLDLDQLARSGSDGDRGHLVLTADRSRRVLIGAAAIGPHADEWIGEAVLAVRAEIQLSVLTQVVHLFPTYSEAYGRLFSELAGKSQ